MLGTQGGGERETGRGPDAVVGQRESRARITVWSSDEPPPASRSGANRPRIGAWSYAEQSPLRLNLLMTRRRDGNVRHIGVDLHKTNFVACFIEDDDTHHLETYPLTGDGLARFEQQLGASDELAVEATQNVHYFYDQVKGHVARVAVVDTYRFGVVAKSKKKTDRADAAALAHFLKLGWLPEVPVPSEQVRTLRELLQARETLVGMRTKLKNMAHAAFSRNGIALTRAAFASASSRARLATRDDLPAADLLVLKVALRQIEQLDAEVKKIEEEGTR